MKSSFARRQPRKVGQDDDEDSNSIGQQGGESKDQKSTPVVKRPSITSRISSKTKKRSSLRTSFGPGGTSMTEDDGDSESVVFTPKKSNLSRQAIEKNALRKSLVANISADNLPLRQTDERPSYSSDYLNELKTSTPSTPQDLSLRDDTENKDNKTLDLTAKFGPDLILREHNSAIPTDTEIREKKARRARLAKEQDFISLDDDGSNVVGEEDDDESNDERSLLPYAQRKSSKKEETRLVRDDEDIAEGFEEFVSDGRVALGKKAEREQKRRQEAEIRNMIDQAEGGGSDDSSEDESEVERNAAYEAAQTMKGMDGLHKDEGTVKPRRARTPPRITPLPTLSSCVDRLQGEMAATQYSLKLKHSRLEEIKKEREDIKARQEEVQRLLKETGERYEKLRAEVDSEGQVANDLAAGTMISANGMAGRGLEALGNG